MNVEWSGFSDAIFQEKQNRVNRITEERISDRFSFTMSAGEEREEWSELGLQIFGYLIILPLITLHFPQVAMLKLNA